MATLELEKVPFVHNPDYTRDGTKSYVALLNKYQFTPTKPGPYYVENTVQAQGRFGANKIGGGKARVHRVLRKKPRRCKPPHGPYQRKPCDPKPAGEKVTSEDIQNDTEYLTPVTIGTPGKTYRLVFDTGSADLWVRSIALKANGTDPATDTHQYFDPASSSTFKETPDASWLISYGDGSSASGNVGTDIVKIGGLSIEGQTIEIARQLTPSLQTNPADGLLGLAYGTRNTVNPSPVKTPVENLIDQKDIPNDKGLFTAYLGSWRDVNDPDKGQSFYTFGFVDKPSLGGQTPFYAPIDISQGLWQFASTTSKIGDREVERTDNTAVADTGATLALIDDALCSAIYDAIPGARYEEQVQGYVFPSNVTADQLPVVSFAVGDQLFPVQKEDLAFADVGAGLTYGGIQSRGSLSFDILGVTWLKSVYAVSLACSVVMRV